jgi:hypothetical protein
VIFESRNSKHPNLYQAAYDEDEGEHRQGPGLIQPWYLRSVPDVRVPTTSSPLWQGVMRVLRILVRWVRLPTLADTNIPNSDLFNSLWLTIMSLR